jgi:hypothetical protein
MNIAIYQHSPMLCRVGIVIDLLSDLLPQTRLLSEPLSAEPSYRMPAYLHGSKFTTHRSFAIRDHVWLRSKTDRVFEKQCAFHCLVLAELASTACARVR